MEKATEDATYEDEHTSRRTVTIPLKEYDELKVSTILYYRPISHFYY